VVSVRLSGSCISGRRAVAEGSPGGDGLLNRGQSLFLGLLDRIRAAGPAAHAPDAPPA